MTDLFCSEKMKMVNFTDKRIGASSGAWQGVVSLAGIKFESPLVQTNCAVLAEAIETSNMTSLAWENQDSFSVTKNQLLKIN